MSGIVPFEKLIEPDSRNLIFRGPITTDDLQELLRGCQLRSEVPEDVKSVFEMARKLFVYGYFVYEFYTLAGFVSILAVESALIHRFEQYYQGHIKLTKRDQSTDVNRYEHARSLLRKGWRLCDDPGFRSGFKSLLLWAGRKKLIDSPELYAESLPKIRASHAHPLFQGISTIGMEQALVARAAELVNKVFSS
jgi:hypothetical protein